MKQTWWPCRWNARKNSSVFLGRNRSNAAALNVPGEVGKLSSYRILVSAANTHACRRRIRYGPGFMTEHLLSLVHGRQGHFRLESGHHGDMWFQLETLCLRSREIQTLTARLAARLAPYEVEVICGPLVEGAFVALLDSLEPVAPSHTRNGSRMPNARSSFQSNTICRKVCSRWSKGNALPS